MIEMRFRILLLLLLFVACAGLSQEPRLYEESFTENTPDKEKFRMYLDSANKYVYRDVQLTSRALNECQQILGKGISIRDSILLEFAQTQIYCNYVKVNPIAAYQVIVDNEHLLQSTDVHKDQVSQIKYLKSFTLMSLGDLEAAQKAY